jgi:hypothetical protein
MRGNWQGLAQEAGSSDEQKGGKTRRRNGGGIRRSKFFHQWHRSVVAIREDSITLPV